MKTKGNPVVFRVGKGTGKVIAIFPADEASPGHCVTFTTEQRTVQRVENYRTVIRGSRPATPNEAQDMLKELRERGLSPSVRQKWRKPKGT